MSTRKTLLQHNGLQSALLGAALSALFLVAPAVAAQSVHTDYDHGAPFSDYHTFSFYRVRTINPLDERVLKNEVRHDLTYHGWREVPSGGDIAITVIGAQHNNEEYQTFYNGLGPGFGWGGWGGWWGGWWGGGWGDTTTTVRPIPVGTLIVDLYDTHTHNLVWRGTSTEKVSPNMNKDTGELQKAIDEMFYKFPPKTGR